MNIQEILAKVTKLSMSQMKTSASVNLKHKVTAQDWAKTKGEIAEMKALIDEIEADGFSGGVYDTMIKRKIFDGLQERYAIVKDNAEKFEANFELDEKTGIYLPKPEPQPAVPAEAD